VRYVPRWHVHVAATKLVVTYLYTDRDGVGVQDPAIRAYECRFVGRVCERAGAWHRGKAVVRFIDTGELAVVRSRLLRKIRRTIAPNPSTI